MTKKLVDAQPHDVWFFRARLNHFWDLLDAVTMYAQRIASGMYGQRYETMREAVAMQLFSQMVSRCGSLLLVCTRPHGGKPTGMHWDYPTTLTVGRSLVEQFAAFHYAADASVSGELFEFRMKALRVHEHWQAMRSLRAVNTPEERAEMNANLEAVRAELAASLAFQDLSSKEQKKLLRGDEKPYARGDAAPAMGMADEEISLRFHAWSDLVHAGPNSYFAPLADYRKDAASRLGIEFFACSEAMELGWRAMTATLAMFLQHFPNAHDWARNDVEGRWRLLYPGLANRPLQSFFQD